MYRRNFFKRCVGAVAGLFGVRQVEEKVQSYTYDWAKNWTNDPRYAAEFATHIGPGRVVLVDGKDVGLYVVRCVTGPNGYAEVQVRDADNKVQYKWGLYDQWDHRMLTPEEAAKVKWQCYSPKHKYPNGKLIPRYIDEQVEIETKIVRGFTEYVVFDT